MKVKRRSNRSKRSTVAVKSNPKLWKSIVKRVKSGSKGGPKGKWSARKAQIAVAKYKSAGGKYKGKKSKSNSLTKWVKEKWDYISPRSRKTKRGRYLPEKVRRSLTPAEKRRENRKKGSKRGKWISYSRSVAKKMRKYKIV
jgi:hypothetical protein